MASNQNDRFKSIRRRVDPHQGIFDWEIGLRISSTRGVCQRCPRRRASRTAASRRLPTRRCPKRRAAPRKRALRLLCFIRFRRFDVKPLEFAPQRRSVEPQRARGHALAPETWSKPGQYVYRRELDADMIAPGLVQINFSLNKSIPPTAQDRRELGIVVQELSIEPL